MDKRLSAVEICKIIKACRLAGVSEFSYSGIELKFHSLGPVSVNEAGQPVSPSEANIPIFPDNQEARLMNEQTLDDAEEAQLLISDPYAYERMQVARDIERNRVLDGQT